MWRSWLARAVWDREAGGSSPLIPTRFMIYLNLNKLLIDYGI